MLQSRDVPAVASAGGLQIFHLQPELGKVSSSDVNDDWKLHVKSCTISLWKAAPRNYTKQSEAAEYSHLLKPTPETAHGSRTMRRDIKPDARHTLTCNPAETEAFDKEGRGFTISSRLQQSILRRLHAPCTLRIGSTDKDRSKIKGSPATTWWQMKPRARRRPNLEVMASTVETPSEADAVEDHDDEGRRCWCRSRSWRLIGRPGTTPMARKI